MSSPRHPAAASSGVEWLGELTLEYEGRRAARLHFRDGRCLLEIASLAALATLRSPLLAWENQLDEAWRQRLLGILPDGVDLVLRGIAIGHFDPAARLNWAAKAAGLPFGNLALDKLALFRASIQGGD